MEKNTFGAILGKKKKEKQKSLNCPWACRENERKKKRMKETGRAKKRVKWIIHI